MDGLIGRDRELALLRGWATAAQRGTGRLVLVEGEPGIGKTTLVRSVAERAVADGLAVAFAQCSALSGVPPYWPIRQVLRALGREPAAVLERDADAVEGRFAVFAAVTDAVRAAAGNGVLVVVDDAHWCDEGSLRALSHLASHLTDAAVLLVIAFRGTEPDSSLPALLPELARAPHTERIRLGGLSAAEVATLAGVDDATAHDIATRTSGNPLFVREMARAIAEGSWTPGRAPRTVLELVGATVSSLSEPVRDLVTTVALAGDAATVPLVGDVLGLPATQCLPLIDAALARGILESPAGATLTFTHALVRDAVVEGLSTETALDWHRRIADVLERRPDADDIAADIARHRLALAALGETDSARAWAVRAGDRALRDLAFEEAIRLYGAALDLAGPWADADAHVHTLLALARAQRLLGHVESGLVSALAGADVARAAGRPDLVGAAALAIEVVPAPAQVGAAIADLCDEAFAGLAPDSHPALRARLLAQRTHLAFYAGDPATTLALSRAAIDLARAAADDDALTDALHARVEACPGPAGRAERFALADEMLLTASRTRRATSAMWGRLWRIDALVEAGEITAAQAELPALERAAARVGGPTSAWHVDRVTACLAQARGDIATADEVARRGLARMLPIEPAPAVGAFIALQCAIARHRGPSEAVLEMIRRGVEPPPRFRLLASVSQAYLLHLAGDLEAAHAQLDRAPDREHWEWPVFFRLVGLGLLAITASDLGRRTDVAAAVAELAPFRHEHVTAGSVSYQGPVTLTLGRVALDQGRVEEAVVDLTDALAAARRAAVPAFAAEAAYHLARALRRRGEAGDEDRARSVAHDSERIVTALGLKPFAGAAPVTDGLSPREAEVADLVAEGLTNREIAQRLVISERTAQNHVQHILTKLGFGSRAQIAAWRARRTAG